MTTFFTKTEFIGNELLLPKNNHLVLPKCLEIELTQKNKRLSFSQICTTIEFIMVIGGSEIIKIPLQLLLKLEKYTQWNQYYYINIPFHLFYANYIKLSTVSYHNVQFILSNFNNQFRSCNLQYQVIELNNSALRTIVRNPHYERIISITSQLIQFSNPLLQQFTNLTNICGIYRGFIIESSLFDRIQNIHFICKHKQLFFFDCHTIIQQQKYIQLNSQLIFFPIDLHLALDGNLQLLFLLQLPLIETHIIYHITGNQLITMCGMAGLQITKKRIKDNKYNYELKCNFDELCNNTDQIQI